MKNSNHSPVEPFLVEKQLQKILTSETFRNSQLLSLFLKFVAEETLAGRLNEIKEYTIATRVLGRPSDFNPQIDAAVRIHAGRLRRLISEYYRSDGLNDEVLIDIPKGSYVPVFKPHSATDERNKKRRAHGIEESGPDGTMQRKVALAVFPFQDLSKDNSDDRFIDTMGEQLCNDLAKFQHLSVISYYSMPKATMEETDIRDLNKIYDLDYVLTGSIRFSEKQVQMNIQFVCAVSGTIAWTQSFSQQYHAGNLYIIQDEVIEQVVNKIADADGIITKNVVNGPLSPKKDVYGVYYAVYQYFGFRGKLDRDSYRQAKTALEQSIIKDPQNALVWSIMANLFLTNHIFQVEPSTGDLERTRDYAERALWLDRNCQYAYAALAWVYLLTGRRNDCVESIERCLDLNPRALSVAGNMGFLLTCLGKYQQGFRLFLRSMHMNVMTAWEVGLGFALYYYHNKDYAESLNWVDRTTIPDFPLKTLIRNAATNKMNERQKQKANKKEPRAAKAKGTEEHNEILERYIFDTQLRESLIEGLALDRTSADFN